MTDCQLFIYINLPEIVDNKKIDFFVMIPWMTGIFEILVHANNNENTGKRFTAVGDYCEGPVTKSKKGIRENTLIPFLHELFPNI